MVRSFNLECSAILHQLCQAESEMIADPNPKQKTRKSRRFLVIFKFCIWRVGILWMVDLLQDLSHHVTMSHEICGTVWCLPRRNSSVAWASSALRCFVSWLLDPNSGQKDQDRSIQLIYSEKLWFTSPYCFAMYAMNVATEVYVYRILEFCGQSPVCNVTNAFLVA